MISWPAAAKLMARPRPRSPVPPKIAIFIWSLVSRVCAFAGPASGGVEGVGQQVRDGHRADAAGDRREPPRHLARPRRRRRRRAGRRPVRLMPTSMTAAPGLIQSPRIISGRPDGGHEDVGRAAEAGQVARARVRHRDRRAARGQQQRHGLAHDQAAPDDDGVRRPRSAIPARSSSHMIPAGVHDTDPGSPRIRRPRLTGAKPSTSLSGWMRLAIAHLRELVGHRQLHEHPVDGVVGVQLVDDRVELGLAVVSIGQHDAARDHAGLLGRPRLARLVELGGGIGRPPGCPASPGGAAVARAELGHALARPRRAAPRPPPCRR